MELNQATIITLSSSATRTDCGRDILESYGFRVIIATTLRGVVSAARACHPDMVLICGSIGREVARAVAHNVRKLRVPVVEEHDGPPDPFSEADFQIKADRTQRSLRLLLGQVFRA